MSLSNQIYCYHRCSHWEGVKISIFQAYCRAYSTWTNSSTWCPLARYWPTWLSASAYSYSGIQLITSSLRHRLYFCPFKSIVFKNKILRTVSLTQVFFHNDSVVRWTITWQSYYLYIYSGLNKNLVRPSLKLSRKSPSQNLIFWPNHL